MKIIRHSVAKYKNKRLLKLLLPTSLLPKQEQWLTVPDWFVPSRLRTLSQIQASHCIPQVCMGLIFSPDILTFICYFFFHAGPFAKPWVQQKIFAVGKFLPFLPRALCPQTSHDGCVLVTNTPPQQHVSEAVCEPNLNYCTCIALLQRSILVLSCYPKFLYLSSFKINAFP